MHSGKTCATRRNATRRSVPAVSGTEVDLRTVQHWFGHGDIESTMRYLKPSRSEHVRGKVDEVFA